MLGLRQIRIILLWLLFLSTTACFGCLGITEIGSPQATQLTDNYYLVCSVSGCQIGNPYGNSSYTVYNTYKVIDVDWDSEFMVIKTRQAEPNETILSWYIINIGSGDLFGPFSYDEYLNERKSLFVSEEVNLLESGKGDFEIYGQRH